MPVPFYRMFQPAIILRPAVAFMLWGTNLVPRAQAVDYEKDIKSIFKERCVSCHGSVKQKGGLRLDAGALIVKGGKDPVIVSGKSKDSMLIERVLTDD